MIAKWRNPDAILHLAIDDINIKEISHNIARICRFAGGVNRVNFYSVAEHSVIVARAAQEIFPFASPSVYMAALLHDAHEAYIGDIILPVKWILDSQKLSDLKHSLQKKVARAFYFNPKILDCAGGILAIDRAVGDIEASKFYDGEWWRDWSAFLRPLTPKKIAAMIRGLSPVKADKEFLATFDAIEDMVW